MNCKAGHTAILLFIRTPQLEAEAKSFVRRGSGRTNQKIAALLNRRAIRLVRRSGLPYYIVDSDQQAGNSFGERFVNALERTLVRYHRVIAIGNDCLGLHRGHLQQAGRQLDRQDLIIGPDYNGGAYLLGLTRDSFDRETWLQFPWQTDRLLTFLKAFARREHLAHSLLAPESDANDARTLMAVLRRLAISSWFCRRILSFFQVFRRPSLLFHLPGPKTGQLTYGLRAPPSV